MTWPARLWLVRHGQSAGNVAAAAAEAAGLPRIDLATRDCDVPLSPLGETQAAAVARWFAALPADARPEVILASPFRRAAATAGAIGAALAPAALQRDERLREREFGILDGLTYSGVATLFPDQAAAHARLGKFYHRPPGGESWADVTLRLRSLVASLGIAHRDRRVVIVAHQVVVLCLRYIVEAMDEADILGIDAAAPVANGSVTEYAFADGVPRLIRYNDIHPVAAAPVTSAPDVPVAAAAVR